MPVETEVKMTVRPDVPGGADELFQQLRTVASLAGYTLGPVTGHQIRDVYFDTAGRALGRRRCALRLREQDGRLLVTLKAAEVWQGGGLAQREEYEEPLDGASLAATLQRLIERGLLGRPAAAAVLLRDFAAGGPAGPLIPVLDVRTRRWNRPVARAGSAGPVATLSLDRVLYAGLPGTVFHDVEIELCREGSAADLTAVRTALEDRFAGQLLPAAESKLVRGLRLQG